MKDISTVNETLFESIKHINEYGQEYWTARELCRVLGYKEFRFFEKVIDKAIEACKNSGNSIADHIVHVHDMVDIGSGAKREVSDYHLSRLACYLIAQNGDPRKETIALAQTYFAIKTRQQELIENYDELSEAEKRIAIRQELKKHNSSLADAAHAAGVITTLDYAIFQNAGYKGLYGGLDAKAISHRKGLKKNQAILDHMGSTELAANLFRATQTDEKLRREHIKGKDKANQTHYEVGAKVRQTIKELGGTMPEDLPTPEKSIKQLEREAQKRLENKKK